ncbi:site-2 protease family protein [Chengkuizengella marina]|uniref:site-2 protease family protein n=1 Tax=Chengkuizengella marina TaxID=2507566 RepID=UPI001371D815|nr:site-2 protease family protein [Chengkuizengella marina]
MKVLVTFILIITVYAPIATFIHELGHAFVALFNTNKEINIKLGKGTRSLNMTLGRIKVMIYPFSGWSGITYVEHFKNLNYKIIFYLSGPIFSIVLSLTCYKLLDMTSNMYILNYSLKQIMVCSLLQFLLTIIPMRYNNFTGGGYATKSDGLRIMELYLDKKRKH